MQTVTSTDWLVRILFKTYLRVNYIWLTLEANWMTTGINILPGTATFIFLSALKSCLHSSKYYKMGIHFGETPW